MNTILKSTAAALVMATATLPAFAAPALLPAAAAWGDVAKYRQVMELNGTSRNARLVLANTRKTLLAAIEEDKGALSPSERERFDALADAAFANLTEQILALVAADQAPVFTDAEIDALIAANSGPAAAAYNAAKFRDQENAAQDTQAYMVEAVVEIIRSFRDNTTIDPAAAPPSGEPNTVQALELLRVDGTEELVRHFVSTVHLSLIMAEVRKYIDVPNLSAPDTARLALIVEGSTRKLGTRLLNRQARQYGRALDGGQLAQLIRANATTAQQKLTRLRLDSSDTDAKSEALMRPVVLELAQAFEAGDE